MKFSNSVFAATVVLFVFTAVAIAAETSLEVSEIKLAIVGEDGIKKVGESIAYPARLSKPLSLEGLDMFKISMQVKDKSSQKGIQPHQAFLLLRNEITGMETVRIFDVRDSGRARLELDLKTGITDFLSGPQTYQIVILIGTFSHPDPLEYPVGQLNIIPPLDTSGKSIAQNTPIIYGPRPVIEHIFRAPQKMPPAAFSTLFAGIVLSPWLILLVGWVSIGVTPAAFGALFQPSILVFYGSLVAIEFILFRYWTHLNIFQTLGYLTPLAVLGFISGQRALTEVQKRREGKEKKSE